MNSYFGYENIWGDKNPLYKSATDKRDKALTLEAVQGVFLNPDTLLCIPRYFIRSHFYFDRSGHMLKFDLVGHEDAGRGWKRKRSGVTVIEMSPLGIRGPIVSNLLRIGPWKKNGHLFLASHVGDSLYIKYSESSNKARIKKQPKFEMDDLDNELYGNTTTNMPEFETVSVAFKFQVVDTIYSLSPIRDMAMGQPVAYSEINLSGQICDFEVVACVGEAQSGSLGIVSRSVRPQILSSFDLEGIIEIWTVKCDNSGYHSYLFLSKEASTIVLKTGSEFTQVKDTDFYTAGPTVTVGSILRNSAILQIEPNKILVLDSGKSILFLCYRWKKTV